MFRNQFLQTKCSSLLKFQEPTAIHYKIVLRESYAHGKKVLQESHVRGKKVLQEAHARSKTTVVKNSHGGAIGASTTGLRIAAAIVSDHFFIDDFLMLFKVSRTPS